MTTAIATREGFSETHHTLQVQETASTAIAAQSKAMVESRYIMAMRNPRNWDQVRLDLIKECRRPSFANNKSAYYIKPIGNGVEGLGIRFVEVALRCMKNVLVETTMIFEDEVKEVHRVSVTDLEANITYPLDVRVSKTVERAKPNSDGSYISVRKNSYGKDTYTILGTDDDLLNKRGALISKAIRTIGLRIIPGDLCDEAEEIIKRIRLDDAAKDPDAERRRIVDAFAAIGVTATDLTSYLGHDLGRCSPAQLVTLRGIYGAIKDGEATWKSVMDNKAEQEGSGGSGNTGGATKPTCTSESFDKQKAGWKAVIESGKKTANALIATIQTKETLSEDQKVEIASWTPAKGAE
ncbi:MAG: hypothetical protein BGO99_02670 [Nitrosospira sp. 56-18]|jgi:hypothetical protein|nr:MAG: hypothetical protein BGO99_02670 [Nitrosospira sp. 56-18]